MDLQILSVREVKVRWERFRFKPEAIYDFFNVVFVHRSRRSHRLRDLLIHSITVLYNLSSSAFSISTALRMSVSSSASAHCVIHSAHCFNTASFWRRKWVRITSSKPAEYQKMKSCQRKQRVTTPYSLFIVAYKFDKEAYWIWFGSFPFTTQHVKRTTFNE